MRSTRQSADHIRASDQNGRAQRPDTWLHPNASLIVRFLLHRGHRPYMTPSRHHAAKFAALREGTSSTLVSPATMPSPGLGKAMKRRPGAGGKTSRAARHAATTRSYPKNFCLVDRSEPLRLLFRPASHPFHRYGPSANWQAENQLRELRAWCAIRATRWFGNTSSARAAGRVPIVEFAGLLTTRPSGIRPRACFGP